MLYKVRLMVRCYGQFSILFFFFFLFSWLMDESHFARAHTLHEAIAGLALENWGINLKGFI